MTPLFSARVGHNGPDLRGAILAQPKTAEKPLPYTGVSDLSPTFCQSPHSDAESQ